MTSLDVLNSATKYPSIPTYHELNPKDGRLIDEVCQLFEGDVVLTEKVDGTNGRVIVMPDGDWFIGSREEILYAKGDRIENPALGIVPALLPLASSLPPGIEDITVYFLEVYGHKIGGAAKQYTSSGRTGYRMFDVARVPADVLLMPRDAISSWREHGGQQFGTEEGLKRLSEITEVPLVPRLGTIDANALPTSLTGMQNFLVKFTEGPNGVPATGAALDGEAGRPEGIVLRSANRSAIAKARFQDYARTIKGR